MTAVDTLVADLRAQRLSSNSQPIVVPVDDLIAALQSLGGATGAAGGDLAGTYPNPTVAKIQGQPISAVAPTAGQILQFSGGVWTPANNPAGAVPVIVQSGGVAGAGALSVTFGVAPTKGNLLVAILTRFATAAVPGPDWQRAANTPGSVSDGFAVYLKIAQAGESVTQSPIGAATPLGVMAIWELSGAKSVDVIAGQHDISATPTIVNAITTTGTNELVLSLFSTGGNNINLPTGEGGGFILDASPVGGAATRAGVMGHQTVAAASTVSPSATWAANPTVVACCSVAVNPG
jgi:hypothetical protein